MKVAVLGATDDAERYGYKAFAALRAKGHEVYGVNPKVAAVDGVPLYPSLAALPARPHTITLYVSPKVSTALAGEILAAAPERILFNPGAENPELAARAAAAGIRTLDACTLVLLSTGRFETA